MEIRGLFGQLQRATEITKFCGFNYYSTCMDCSKLCAGSVSEDICRESYSEKSHIEHNQCTCSCMKETVKTAPLEALNLSTFGKDDDLIVQEVGSPIGVILHAHNVDGESPGLDATPDPDETDDVKMCQEFYRTVSLDEKVEKGLSKCATFPCSAGVRGREGLPCTIVQGPLPSTFESASYGRSMSLPTSFKLVSAMKGGRTQNGISASPDAELRVKWAPEVFDPPATSMSHTVRSHHYQRPKGKRNGGSKHKKNKGGKSSRGSGSERKTTTSRSSRGFGIIPDHPLMNNMRLQPTGNGYNTKSNEEVYAVSGREDKCRSSSFMRDGLDKVQLPIAEAS